MKKILYIDDQEDCLQLFQSAFQSEYNIFVANSAEKGLQILQEENIPIVISDQKMPDISGLDLFKKLQYEEKNTVHILLTAYKEVDIAIEAINNGQVFKYITKPFEINYVKEAIESAFLIFNSKNSLKQSNTLKSTLKNNFIDDLQNRILLETDSIEVNFENCTSELNNKTTTLAAIIQSVQEIEEEQSLFSSANRQLSTIIDIINQRQKPPYLFINISKNFPSLPKTLETHIYNLIMFFNNYAKVEHKHFVKCQLHSVEKSVIELSITIEIDYTTSKVNKFNSKVKTFAKLYKGHCKMFQTENNNSIYLFSYNK